MDRMTDDKLDMMLSNYCEAEPEKAFVYKPDHRRKPVILSFAAGRRLTAAAGLVLVSALSIALYFLFGNKMNTPIVISPSTQSTVPHNTDGAEAGSDSPSDSPDSTVAETQAKGLIEMIADFLGLSDERTESPTEAPTPPGGTRPASATVPTAPYSPEPTSGIVKPAVPSESSGSETQGYTPPPTAKPTVPVEPPWVEYPTEGEIEPIEPTDSEPWLPPYKPPETEPPTEGEIETPGCTVGVFRAKLDLSLLSGYDGGVYCKIYDSKGRLLGDSNLYSDEHLADVELLSKYADAYYEAEVPELGYYNYVFYTEEGRLLAQGQVYVDR